MPPKKKVVEGNVTFTAKPNKPFLQSARTRAREAAEADELNLLSAAAMPRLAESRSVSVSPVPLSPVIAPSKVVSPVPRMTPEKLKETIDAMANLTRIVSSPDTSIPNIHSLCIFPTAISNSRGDISHVRLSRLDIIYVGRVD
jgi:hypothetical protein